jgi:uncharacterized protein (DUF697 family)
VRGTSSSEIRKQASLPVSLLIVGDQSQFELLVNRLGSPNNAVKIDPGMPVPDDEAGRVLLDSARMLAFGDKDFEEALGKIAIRHADRRIVLAATVPAFRNTVVNQLAHERAYENAKFAAISAIPGILPLTDWLLPATSAGDLFVLTKNQIMLLLEVAACYGRPPDASARIKELLPVVGSAFGWRAVARELIGLVPGGIGVAVKAAVAYAGTYSVGRAAAFYYAGGGRRMSETQLSTVYKTALADAFKKGVDLVARK